MKLIILKRYSEHVNASASGKLLVVNQAADIKVDGVGHHVQLVVSTGKVTAAYIDGSTLSEKETEQLNDWYYRVNFVDASYELGVEQTI